MYHEAFIREESNAGRMYNNNNKVRPAIGARVLITGTIIILLRRRRRRRRLLIILLAVVLINPDISRIP
jgi:multisubunit Na+/H+ antiporter MnhG subunit